MRRRRGYKLQRAKDTFKQQVQFFIYALFLDSMKNLYRPMCKTYTYNSQHEFRTSILGAAAALSFDSFCNASELLTESLDDLFLSNGILMDWRFGLFKKCNLHLLGLTCPSNFICSLLNFLFVYHFPPRHPKAYLHQQKSHKKLARMSSKATHKLLAL